MRRDKFSGLVNKFSKQFAGRKAKYLPKSLQKFLALCIFFFAEPNFLEFPILKMVPYQIFEKPQSLPNGVTRDKVSIRPRNESHISYTRLLSDSFIMILPIGAKVFGKLVNLNFHPFRLGAASEFSGSSTKVCLDN